MFKDKVDLTIKDHSSLTYQLFGGLDRAPKIKICIDNAHEQELLSIYFSIWPNSDIIAF
ncbi:hypothetical protein OQJ05_12895 [Fluoribacter gormanii]|uniref:hypothetical protein n=1 Tax=Fluoribacter gormanii TaxID=464 RepID=UPI002244663D|nr:hypothetical protein [Fluoribacter gormanii]MCW8444947.1 hypothetical protein [Fluoribacter gormanii]